MPEIFEYADQDVKEILKTGGSEENLDVKSQTKDADPTETAEAGDNDGGAPADDMTPAEMRARKDGWAPKDQWKGDETSWVDYAEFNRRGELMRRISKQSQEIQDLKKEQQRVLATVSKLSEHNAKLADFERKKAIKELRKDKAAAVRQEDDEAVAAIEENIEELQELDPFEDFSTEEEGTEEEEQGGEAMTGAQEALRMHYPSWAETSEVAARATDPVVGPAIRSIGDSLYDLRTNASGEIEGVTAEEFYEELDEKVKEYYPHLFQQTKTKKRPPQRVSGRTEPQTKSSGRAGGKATYTFADLDDEQKAVAMSFEKQGVMTRAEYVTQIAAMNELPAQRGE